MQANQFLDIDIFSFSHLSLAVLQNAGHRQLLVETIACLAVKFPLCFWTEPIDVASGYRAFLSNVRSLILSRTGYFFHFLFSCWHIFSVIAATNHQIASVFTNPFVLIF